MVSCTELNFSFLSNHFKNTFGIDLNVRSTNSTAKTHYNACKTFVKQYLQTIKMAMERNMLWLFVHFVYGRTQRFIFCFSHCCCMAGYLISCMQSYRLAVKAFNFSNDILYLKALRNL